MINFGRYTANLRELAQLEPAGGDAMEELKSFLYSTGRPNDGADAATIELISGERRRSDVSQELFFLLTSTFLTAAYGDAELGDRIRNLELTMDFLQQDRNHYFTAKVTEEQIKLVAIQRELELNCDGEVKYIDTSLADTIHLLLTRGEVSFQWKNPDFLLRNPDFLIKNPDFLLKNVDFIIMKPGQEGEQAVQGV